MLYLGQRHGCSRIQQCCGREDIQEHGSEQDGPFLMLLSHPYAHNQCSRNVEFLQTLIGTKDAMEFIFVATGLTLGLPMSVALFDYKLKIHGQLLEEQFKKYE